MTLRPTIFFCRFCWNDSACTLFPATTTQLFCHSLSSHTLCHNLEFFSTTNNNCNFWHSKFQQVSTNAFCSWDDLFTQKGNCSSANNLCNCTDTPPTVSTNTSIEWNLYLPWSRHLITSFRLELKVGGFSKHHNKTDDTDRCDVKCVFSPLVSLKSM